MGGPFSSGWFPTHEYLDNRCELEGVDVDLEVVKGRSEDEEDQNNYMHLRICQGMKLYFKKEASL